MLNNIVTLKSGLNIPGTQIVFRCSFSATCRFKTGTLDYSLEVCKNH